MQELKLKREILSNKAVLGTLELDGRELCKTLENPWLDNTKDISCIPEGTYKCKPHSRRFSDTWKITGVSKRSGIVFHTGNTESDTEGCILTGSVIGSLSGERAVLGSRRALNKLRDYIGTTSVFDLTIKGLAWN